MSSSPFAGITFKRSHTVIFSVSPGPMENIVPPALPKALGSLLLQPSPLRVYSSQPPASLGEQQLSHVPLCPIMSPNLGDIGYFVPRSPSPSCALPFIVRRAHKGPVVEKDDDFSFLQLDLSQMDVPLGA